MTKIDRRTAFLQLSAITAAAAFLPRALRGQSPTVAGAANPTGPFTLPALPYAYDALEPYIDAATMHLHHDKHHQSYVNNLNAAVASHPELSGKTIEDLIANLSEVPNSIREAIRNQGGGHLNHSLFWTFLGKGSPSPKGELARAIDTRFGSFGSFQEKLTTVATGIFGSGWVWLTKLSDGSLALEQTANQDSPLSNGHRPLLAVDVWEHAYYLKYQNRRAEYVKAILNVMNWDEASRRYAAKG
jgi:Fe-Mn family superoxide dismutase